MPDMVPFTSFRVTAESFKVTAEHTEGIIG